MIIGLCKTFSGHEFVSASVASVYPFLDKIVFVHSDLSWNGDIGNSVKGAIMLLDDPDNKFVHVSGEYKTQSEQYTAGMQIAQSFDPDWVMFFDTDEVWDNEQLGCLIEKLNSVHIENAVCCSMKTYVKTPFYRVEPPEVCRPVVFIRGCIPYDVGCRGSEVMPKVIFHDIYFHHFTYVRGTWEDVRKKILTSEKGDEESGKLASKIHDINEWKKQVWDKLPNVTDFHIIKGFERSWHSVQNITINDLPEAVKELPIIRKDSER